MYIYDIRLTSKEKNSQKLRPFIKIVLEKKRTKFFFLAQTKETLAYNILSFINKAQKKIGSFFSFITILPFGLLKFLRRLYFGWIFFHKSVNLYEFSFYFR